MCSLGREGRLGSGLVLLQGTDSIMGFHPSWSSPLPDAPPSGTVTWNVPAGSAEDFWEDMTCRPQHRLSPPVFLMTSVRARLFLVPVSADRGPGSPSQGDCLVVSCAPGAA